jgi:RNA polymerase sigma-70 factor (ECF subfamily)
MPAEAARLRAAMREHLPLVWRVLRRLGLNEWDADEAAQDVFLVLSRRLDDVPVRAQRSFLISTALRVASDRRRSAGARALAPLQPELPSPGLPPDELVALRRARGLLDEALAALNPEQRAVFVLVEMEELGGPEVAEVLGIPPGTVASRLRRARQVFEAAIRRMRLRELRRGA